MKILHVLPSLDPMFGGPLRAVVDLSAASREFGLDSHILGLGEHSIPDCSLPSEFIHHLRIGRPHIYSYSTHLVPWLSSNLSNYNGVVMHGLWSYTNWATHRMCIQTSTKYACFPHGMLEPWPVYRQGIAKQIKKTVYWHFRERKIFEWAETIFFTTARERALASATFDLPARDRIVIPYGVAQTSCDKENPPSSSIRLRPKTKNALFLGRVHPKKNVHFLIDTWIKAAMPPDWNLIIAGPAEHRYLKSLRILAEPARKNIRFVGPVVGNDKRYLFQNCHWFLLPSQQENFGVAVLEAISHGCPVAISDQVYLADSLHEDSEILPVRQDAWINFLRTRMQDETWRLALRKKDLELIVPKFAIRNVAQAWARTLQEVFGANSCANTGSLMNHDPEPHYV